ncbi:MAG TPA: hypothetical protein VMR46_01150 [Candidatus Paceibacterota bacterium]|jgi:hypothetical protein|nr:hypothetical protein [Candidatus Paceibacterota bacterium]
MKSSWLQPLLWWVYAAIAVTGICALVYGAVQQNYRQSANDPQIQMAEDAAAQIVGGTSPSLAVPAGTVDIGNSLAPWVAVYNGYGGIIGSNGSLSGEAPSLPQGVFKTYENRFTWQPTPSVRQAVVLVYIPAPNGPLYVASGRSLREVEVRESALTLMVALAWAFTLACLLVASFAGWWLLRVKK